MKKTYEKPMILFEDFSLSTNIAGDCEKRINSPVVDSCAYSVKVGVKTFYFFTDAINACTTKDADGEYDGFCYHVPYGQNLFNS